MNTSKLEELLHYILLDNNVSRLFVVEGCEILEKFNPHFNRKEFLKELFSKNAMRNLFRNHTIVFIDVNPLNMQSFFIIHPFVSIRDMCITKVT